MAYGDHIKIHITNTDTTDDGPAGESVWAEELGNNQARIDNIPFFFNEFSIDDIVEYEVDENGIKEFVKVLKKVSNTWGVTWEPSDRTNAKQTTEEWHKIADHLKANNVRYEAAMAGIFVIALPADKPDEESIIWLKALKYSSPIDLTLYID